MTKKDYIKFAELIIDTSHQIARKHLDSPDNVLLYVWEHMADIFYNDNGNFAYSKFNNYINNKLNNK